MSEPTVAAGFVTGLLLFAVGKGADRQQLLARSRIHPEDLSDQDKRIALSRYLALMEAGIESCGDPALALHFGEAVPMRRMSIVGLICQSAETALEAYEQCNRYVRLMVDAEEGDNAEWFGIERSDGDVWFTFRPRLYVDHLWLAESAFARARCEFRRFFGDRPFAREVHFTHAEPRYRADYERIFQAPIVFNSDRNALLMAEDFRTLKMAQPDRYVFGILSDHADALLKDLERSNTMRGRVESILIPMLHKGELRMDQVARKLGVSRQTLYRRLKVEGVSYAQLLDQLRQKMALHYLSGQKVSVNETAYLVGFSDPSAFSRAFKRWTGHSPSAEKPALRSQASTGIRHDG